MHLDLSDEETAALRQELHAITESDRYPLSPHIQRWTSVPKNVLICKLCATEAKLIDAHVIPRSFWEIDHALPAPKTITNIKGEFPKKIPIGVYDQTIVCDRCERGFSDYDSYAADLLFNRSRNLKKYEPITGN